MKSRGILPLILMSVVAILFFWGLFSIAKGVFTILGFLAPLMLIGALIINYKVVLQFGNFLINKVVSDPIKGILMVLGSFFLFPLVATFLLIAAVGSKKLQGILGSFESDPQVFRQAQEPDTEEADFEIIADEEIETLSLPEQKIEVQKPGEPDKSKYEDLF